MAEDDNAWVLDSLVNFLRGPVWHVPIMTFIEHKSLTFEECEDEEEKEKRKEDETKIHQEYKTLVDFMLGSYMEDMGISPEQFESACGKAAINTPFHQTLFEQVWAADDFQVFRRMMIQKNLELQLQTLEILQQRYGIVPESCTPAGGLPTNEQDLMNEVIKTTDTDVLEEIKKKSLEEHEALEGNLDTETKDMEKAIAESSEENRRIETQMAKEQEMLERALKMSLSEEGGGGEDTKMDKPSAPPFMAASTIDPEEVKRRQEYLKRQRDRLLALKQKERERQLATYEQTNNTANERPKSATAARKGFIGLSGGLTCSVLGITGDLIAWPPSPAPLILGWWECGGEAVMADRMARRRVKLYALNADRQWDDRGTGHVTSSYVERLKGMSLLVRAESDGSLLLESRIQADTAYQKQQGTLIVWSEGENFDLALSFQEKVGCDEIWEKICQVQGKDPSVDITQEIVEESEDERFDDVSDSNPWVELPPCDISRLEDINEVISNCLHSPMRREKLAIALENEGYVKKLVSVFHTCEDLDNTDGLHLLYEIFKNIFLLNKNALFEIMFADDTIFDVVGCLEYDPTSPYPKRHRQYLKSIAKFKEVIPIENSELLSKIHQTYRVQYIQDVVLPTPAVFEENMLSTLSSFIFFNKVEIVSLIQVEIVSLIQEDERFLSELFQQLGDDDVPTDKRRDLVLFLKEFCTFSQTLQPTSREAFFKTLSSLGVLSALETTLGLEDSVIKSASIDILSYIVEFSPSMVREYMMQQPHKAEEEQYLLNIIIEQMVVDSDPEMGGAVQLMGILRILIDPENMMATVTKSERSDFLNFLYKHSMHYLVAPLLSNTVGEEVGREDYSSAQLLALILELLAFCVEHHTYHIKNYIVQRDLLNRILVLMKSKHTFLVLSALRFMRKIVGLRDDFYNRHIVNSNLFAPVVDAFVRNNGRYNLLDSAIIEMFEYIKVEDIKSLWVSVVEKFGEVLSRVDYVQTFHALRLRYQQHQDRLKDRDRPTSLDGMGGVVRGGGGGGGGAGRYRRDVRDLEEEEEMWFNNEEEEMEESDTSPPLSILPPTAREPGFICATMSGLGSEKPEKEAATPLPSGGGGGGGGGGLGLLPGGGGNNNNNNNNNGMAAVGGGGGGGGGGAPTTPQARRKVSLVAYEENSDEEEEEEEEEDIGEEDQEEEEEEEEDEGGRGGSGRGGGEEGNSNNNESGGSVSPPLAKRPRFNFFIFKSCMT
ncbi:hypothetical protein Pcinc_024948 [Petrolisthes cinctipes]|uniref:Coiled-coil domain-containing protein 104 n=1 Tax=Petrolisthes cinctipes TaxID=88211 RepID=A0AAE1KDQ2_PETCI|nr:hypothetical protein Pcinc_024948 [Petrolisthes cinctipes]